MPQPHQPRALLHLLLALCVATACTTPTATTPDATAEADAAPDVLADVVAPDVAVEDVADVADAVDVAADVSVAGLVVQSSEATLVPPPLTVGFSATKNGVDMSAECSWTVGPPSVCVLADAGHVKKVGDGTCVVTCALASGEKASKELVAKAQTVIYALGGAEVPSDVLKVSRYRVADKAWDPLVALLPETRYSPALAVWNGKLVVVGGSDVQAGVSPGQPIQVPASKLDCPELKYFGGTDFGCRVIRTLDLSTGAWGVLGSLPAARRQMNAVQVAKYLMVSRGETQAADGSTFHRLDLETGEWADLGPFLPEQGPYQIVSWGKGVLAYVLGSSAAAFEVNASGTTWQPFALSVPGLNSTPIGALWSTVSPIAGLLVLPSGPPKVDISQLPGGCLAANGAQAGGCNFARMVGGTWDIVPGTGTWFETAAQTGLVAPDGLYRFAVDSCQSGFPTAWHLASITGAWDSLPPEVPCRYAAGYASTIQ